jgi:hypothetical protein
LRVDLDSGQEGVGSNSERRKSPVGSVEDVVLRYKVEDMWSGGGKGVWGVYGYYSPGLSISLVLYCGVLYCNVLMYYTTKTRQQWSVHLPFLCIYSSPNAQTLRPELHGVNYTW